MHPRHQTVFFAAGVLLTLYVSSWNSATAAYYYDDMMEQRMGLMSPNESMMGFGMGRRGAAMYSALNLTDDQQKKINAIQDGIRKKHWEKMGEIMDLQAKLRDTYEKDTPDPKAVGELYEKISQIRRSMIEDRVATQNKIRDLLSDRQREQLKSESAYGYGWGGPMGPGMMGPGMMGPSWRYSLDE